MWDICIQKKKCVSGRLGDFAGLIRKDKMDARKNIMESLLLLTDAMRSFPDSDDIESCDILCVGGDDGINMEGLGSIGVDVFYIVFIGWVDNNKDCFEEMDYNKSI